MLALFLTLFDIIRLRKGPEAIPYSWILCLVALTIWLVAGYAISLSTESMNDEDFLNSTFTGVAGLACYAAVIVSSGHTPRLLQTMTAIVGCGAVISILYLVETVALGPLLGEPVTTLIAMLIVFWSVPVEGHIIARAINRHWYMGIIVAMAVFVFQWYLYAFLNTDTAT
jgi:hypothetical protein